MGSIRLNKGRWTHEEHQAFLRGVHLHDRNWEVVAALVPTRTVLQIRTHSQKYFAKIERGETFPDQPYPSQYDAAAGNASALAGAYMYGQPQQQQQPAGGSNGFSMNGTTNAVPNALTYQRWGVGEQQQQQQAEYTDSGSNDSGGAGGANLAVPATIFPLSSAAYIGHIGGGGGGGGCCPSGSSCTAAKGSGNVSGFSGMASTTSVSGGLGCVSGVGGVGGVGGVLTQPEPIELNWTIHNGSTTTSTTTSPRLHNNGTMMAPTAMTSSSFSHSPPPAFWSPASGFVPGLTSSSGTNIAWGGPPSGLSRWHGGNVLAGSGGGGGGGGSGSQPSDGYNQQQRDLGLMPMVVNSIQGGSTYILHQQQQQQQQQLLQMLQHASLVEGVTANGHHGQVTPFEGWGGTPLLSDAGGEDDEDSEFTVL